MYNFEYYNPTRLVFGKGTIARIANLIPKNKKILITYGGGSIFKNGVMDQVKSALKNHDFTEFGGIEPNPEYETLMKAVKIVKDENIDYLLAVGGGSVLDGTKFIAAAAVFEGEPWEIMEAFGSNITKAIPLSTILTLPATGSESNPSAVISRREFGKKTPFHNDAVRPDFAILDPETTYSLPLKQTINGIVDAYVHIMEQYMVVRKDTPIQDHMAEALLKTLHECGLLLVSNPTDYNLRSQIMYTATLALNQQLGLGVDEDWATHMLGHELTAKYGIDHGASLSMIMPALFRVRMNIKEAKLKTYTKEVLGMSGKIKGEDVVQQIEAFFMALGSPIRLPDYVTEDQIDELVANLRLQHPYNIGEDQKIDAKMAKEIYMKALPE